MIYEEYKYVTSDDFFKAILPNGDLSKKLSNYVYRGHSSEKWQLIPSVLRQENKTQLFYKVFKSRPDDETEIELWQIINEFELLKSFFIKSNNVGLRIPKSDIIKSSYLDSSSHEFVSKMSGRYTGSFKWLFPGLDELAALAQHYGTLTRLLDWTQDIFVAIYFAASEACKKYYNAYIKTHISNIKFTDSMVIWALHFDTIEKYKKNNEDFPLKFVVPSYSDNPNICAQKGILSYWEKYCPNNVDKELYKSIDRDPLDQILKEYNSGYFENYPIIDYPFPLLLKILIPVECCFKAMIVLKQLGYTGARLFPGYNGITKEIEEDIMIDTIDLHVKGNIKK